MPLHKKALAEFIGTFCLVFVGTGAVVVNDLTGQITHLGIAVAFGLVVATMIFSYGQVSGAHINPAVSLGFVLLGKLRFVEFLIYVLVQILGAIVASFLLSKLFPEGHGFGLTMPVGSLQQSFWLELIITFMLMTVILRIPQTDDVVVKAALSVGFAVWILALFAGPISGASMNPARSIGPAVVAAEYQSLWVYIVSPCLGVVFAVVVDQAFR